jgi:hypothetical protein
VVTWGRGGAARARGVAPGLHRFAHERGALACGGAVALDLPRIALRAGAWREDRALELASAAVASAVEALGELAASFQQRHGGPRPGDLRGRVAYAVTPVGLREALAQLGDGEVRPEQGARLVGFLGEAVRRFGEARKLFVVLAPYFGERARVRFAALDAELPQHAQRLLFGERDRERPSAAYGAGYRLSPVPGRAPWSAEVELLSTVPAGALHPLPEDRSRGGVVGLVDAWQRFDRLREARSAETPSSAARERPSPLFESLTAPGAIPEKTR